MTRATPVQAYGTADAPAEAGHAAVARLATLSREFAPDLGVVIHDNLEAAESEWRRFEDIADCTAFQSFDWLATWHRHIGRPDGVRPVIVVGSYADGETAFILPLAIVSKRGIRRLCWFGQEQCDYNAPLLARDFSQRVAPERFLAAWRDLREQMQRDPRLRHDWIELEKMPQMVGTQTNPFLSLDVTANASGAHLTQLGDDWEKFYFAKRSSATRRRDRAKRRHMSEYGEIRFVTATESRRRAAHAGNLDRSKAPRLRAPGHSRYFCAAGIARILSRPRLKSENPPSVPHQPRRSRRHLGGGEFRDPVRRLLLPRAGELRRRRRAVALRARRAASARIACARDQARAAALRFHHRRRAVQGRMVRYQRKTLRSQRGGDLARLAGERRVDGAAPAQALRQADAVDLETGLAPARHGRRADASEVVAAASVGNEPAPPRRSRTRRSPASWATWICCSRSRRPAFPAPW